MISPLPTVVRGLNGCDGKSLIAGWRASSAKKSDHHDARSETCQERKWEGRLGPRRAPYGSGTAQNRERGGRHRCTGDRRRSKRPPPGHIFRHHRAEQRSTEGGDAPDRRHHAEELRPNLGWKQPFDRDEGERHQRAAAQAFD
jgi:hypothetical protein